ncbi:MAG TPA: ABC transporter ATP-binding protein [Puia sp.]|nr:ABC transporter ATP-binding protein [Puia sp.]
MDNTIALKASNIVKYFYEPEEFQVLKGLSFEVRKGEFLSLTGKSGSGKSTLLYVLSTMDTDYQGELEINGGRLTGRTQNELAAFRNEHIGFVFQFHYLLTEFSVLDNVMLPALKLKRKSRQEIEAKAYSDLEMLGLKDQVLKMSGKLSGGQQQRVAIARALINEPSIIMGDEPTGNLDSKNTQVVFDIFKQLARDRGQTIIAVTHDEDFARNSDRIIDLSDGQIVGTDEGIARPGGETM